MSVPRFRLVQGRAIGETSNNSNSGSTDGQQTRNASTVSPQPPGVPPQQNAPPQSIPSVQSVPNGLDHSVPPNAVPQHPVAPSPQMPQPMQIQQQPQPIPSNPQQPAHPSQLDERNAVSKCVRFLKTLLSLSNNPNQSSDSQNNPVLVRQLIANVIYGDITAEEFTGQLQAALNSQAQPHLLPFLRNTIPALRNAVRNGEVSIEGVHPPPGYVFNNVRAPIPDANRHVSSPHIPPPQPAQPSQLLSRLSSAPNVPSPHMQPRVVQQPQQQIHQNLPPPQSPMNQPSINQPAPPPQIQPQQPVQHISQPSTSQPSAPPTERVEEEGAKTRPFGESMLKSAILRPDEIMNRITKRMMVSCYVEEEALLVMADAAESHLRELIAQIAGIAEHRAESMRIGDNYTPIDDTKRQLRFLEDLDRQEEELRENREKETLIRMSKNKNSGKETIEKAKEMQRADAEAKRNRDANAAAIAALSSNRTGKNKWESAPTNASTNQRPRTVRVTTRDLHLMVNTDNRFHGTFLQEKLAYGGPSTDANI